GARRGAAPSWSRWTRAPRPRSRPVAAARAAGACPARSRGRARWRRRRRSYGHFGKAAAQEVLSSSASAANRAFHRRRPAGVRPRAGADDVVAARLEPRPARAGAERDRRVGLAADARPEELGLAEALRQLPGDPVDELAAAHLQELGHAA